MQTPNGSQALPSARLLRRSPIDSKSSRYNGSDKDRPSARTILSFFDMRRDDGHF